MKHQRICQLIGQTDAENKRGTKVTRMTPMQAEMLREEGYRQTEDARQSRTQQMCQKQQKWGHVRGMD